MEFFFHLLEFNLCGFVKSKKILFFHEFDLCFCGFVKISKYYFCSMYWSSIRFIWYCENQ